jgi:hypothetical protein
MYNKTGYFKINLIKINSINVFSLDLRPKHIDKGVLMAVTEISHEYSSLFHGDRISRAPSYISLQKKRMDPEESYLLLNMNGKVTHGSSCHGHV